MVSDHGHWYNNRFLKILPSRVVVLSKTPTHRAHEIGTPTNSASRKFPDPTLQDKKNKSKNNFSPLYIGGSLVCSGKSLLCGRLYGLLRFVRAVCSLVRALPGVALVFCSVRTSVCHRIWTIRKRVTRKRDPINVEFAL